MHLPIILSACFVAPMVTAAIISATHIPLTTPAPVFPSNGLAPSQITKGLEVRKEEYNGPVEVRANPPDNMAAYFFGNAMSALVPLTGGACALAALNPGALPVCVAAVAFSAVFFGVNVLLGFVHLFSGTKRSEEGHRMYLDAYDQYEYGRFHPVEVNYSKHISEAFAAQNVSTPLFLAHKMCGEGEHRYACQAIWYSNTQAKDTVRNKTIHRVHVTPPDHKWTSDNHTDSHPRPSKTVEKRQATTVTTDVVQVTATDSGQVIYGGYVWSDYDDSGEEAFVDDENMNATAISQDLINVMSSQNSDSDGSKYDMGGVYCQSWTANSTDTDLATEGYLWYYDSMSSYMSSDEEQYLETCQQDATQNS